MIRTVVLIVITLTLIGCKKKSDPSPPEGAQLVFPDRNSECTTGANLSDTVSEVEFRWQSAANTDNYELRVTNINTGVTQNITTTSTSARLPIAKGEPFSWLVRSRNSEVTQSVSSESWNFYNAGSRTTFAPFPADIISPRMSESVFRNINNEIELEWTATDLDDDIVEFDIYLSTETPPNDLMGTVTNDTDSFEVSVTSNTVYYWNIVTRDEEGNLSNSGIHSFKVM